jgi:hypothetical protein
MQQPQQYADDVASAERIAVEGVRAFIAATLHRDVVFNAVLGLRAILRLANHPGVAGMSAELVGDLLEANGLAVSALAETVQKQLSEERINLGLGAAAGLVGLFGKSRDEVVAASTFNLVMDRIDHVALLTAELDVVHLNQSIERRGDVLRRAIVLSRFRDQSISNDLALH